MRKRILLMMAFLLSFSAVQAKNRNVILRISRYTQKDTLGYNLLDRLPGVVYEAILDNRVKLWDSQQKRLEITASTLRDIEKSYKLSFKEIDNVFLYEIWTEKKKTITAVPQGILFATRNDKNEEISFGYVDYRDVESLFSTALLPVNANGFLDTDVQQVLLLKRYDYSIVQYGTKLITNSSLSEKIKNDVFHRRMLVSAAAPAVQSKRVVYSFERQPSGDAGQQVANQLLDTLGTYLQNNPEEYFNMGADRFDNYVNQKEINVNKAEVVEIWTKSQGAISFRPEQVVIYSNDFSLDPQPAGKLAEWKLTAGGTSYMDALMQKKFSYSILKINDQVIRSSDAAAYAEALQKAGWTQLTEYVKQR
jgi:hypothetical protein